MPINQPYKALKLVLFHSVALGIQTSFFLVGVVMRNLFGILLNLFFIIFNILILFEIFKKEREALDKMLSV